MSDRTGHLWCAADDDILRQMVALNRSPFLISAKLKRTVGSVRRRATELGLHVQSPAAARRKAKTISESARIG